MSIFISHSSRDDRFVNQMLTELHAQNIVTWVDHFDIPPGKRWVEMVDQALERSHAMVLVWSKSALASRHVQTEWQAFMDLQRPIFPVVIDNSRLPLILRSVQHVDFSQDGDFYKQLTKLLQAVPAPEGTTQTFEVVPHDDNTQPVAKDNRNTGLLNPLVVANAELAHLSLSGRQILKGQGKKIAGGELQVVCLDDEKVFSYPTSEPIIVGRKHEDSLSYPDLDLTTYEGASGVSRQHAMIARTKSGTVYIIDLWSRNGTFIGHKQLEPKKSYKVPNGAIIFFSRGFPIMVRYK